MGGKEEGKKERRRIGRKDPQPKSSEDLNHFPIWSVSKLIKIGNKLSAASLTRLLNSDGLFSPTKSRGKEGTSFIVHPVSIPPSSSGRVTLCLIY